MRSSVYNETTLGFSGPPLDPSKKTKNYADTENKHIFKR